MTLDRDGMIAARRRGEQWDDAKAIREEDSACRLLLKLAAAAPSAVRVKIDTAQRNRVGHTHLTYDLLREVLPTFPIWLGHSTLDGERLHTSSRATVSALFTRFAATPFAKAYETFHEDNVAEAETRGLAVGMTFGRKGIASGLIIHDGYGLADLPIVGTRLCRRPVDSKLTLWVDAYAALLRAVRSNGWQAEYAL